MPKPETCIQQQKKIASFSFSQLNVGCHIRAEIHSMSNFVLAWKSLAFAFLQDFEAFTAFEKDLV